MISRLELRNFTVFAEAKLDFSPQLNVIVGENGTGKTHLLKVMYSLQRITAETNRNALVHGSGKIMSFLERKLQTVFRVDKLERLAREGRRQKSSLVGIEFNNSEQFLHIDFIGGDHTLGVDKSAERFFVWEKYSAIFLPTREMLSIYPNFVSVYETTELEFDETWRDTAVALGAPLKKNLGSWEKNVLTSIEHLLGGEITLSGGRFYLRVGDTLREAPLLAEGHRKLAMLAQLVANGSIQKGSVLFWDEPEANLNAKLIRQIAQIIMVLAHEGVQVFIATHSLFLLKEIEILNVMGETGPVQTRFFGLHSAKDGVQVMQGDTPFDMGTITALEEELQQTDRFLEANDVAREKENAAEAPAKKKKQSSRRKPQ